MKKNDARQLSQEAQKEKRCIAFRMKEKGYQHREIAEVVGVNISTISAWMTRAKAVGKEQAIAGGRRGVQKGEGKRLTPLQEQKIQHLLKEYMPDELGMPDALWTRRSVQALVRSRCHVLLPISTMGLYLQRWGFTPQKPAKQAYEQQSDLVKEWLDETYPKIKERAKQEKAEIHWGDETGIRNHCQHGRSYAPKNNTPVRKFSGKRFSINMISSITNQGKVRFMLYEESFTADVFIRFLRRLVRGASGKVFLILDNLRVHHAIKVKEWLESRVENIELFFLPPYSPELNPDEYLNCDLKAQVHSLATAKDKKDLKRKVNKSMRLLQKRPKRVESYFRHSKIAYAA